MRVGTDGLSTRRTAGKRLGAYVPAAWLNAIKSGKMKKCKNCGEESFEHQSGGRCWGMKTFFEEEDVDPSNDSGQPSTGAGHQHR